MRSLTALVGAIVLCVAAVAAQADPLAGTWQLNLAKSRYIPARMAPVSQTRTYRVEGNQIVARHTNVDAEGNKTLIEFTATLDGKPCPLKGYPDWDAISMKRIDEYSTEFTQYRNGQPSLAGTLTRSSNGKALTLRATGIAANGDKVDVMAVFDRVDHGTSR